MRRRLACATAVVVLAFGLSGMPTAESVRRDDPTKERERVRAREAAVASHLDVQKASLAKIDAALQALNANLSTQRSLLNQANQELADARRQLDLATAAVGRAKRQIAQVRSKMRTRAIAAYMDPPGNRVIDLLEVQSARVASYRQMYAEVQATTDADLTDQLKGARADLDFERGQAAEARKLAASKQAEQQARTNKVSSALARQRAFSAALKRRIDSAVAESIGLSRTDRALSVRIALEQAALAARLAAARAAAQAAAARAAANRAAANRAAANRAAAARSAAVASQTNTFRPNGSESAALPPVSSGSVASTSGGISLATVNGITVNAQIAGQLSALVNAARAAGLNLTGGGYRSPAQQVALRQAHCGSSYYAIYQMSAGACHPPTAPPGQSMHEVGLAIDFSNSGSHSTAVFQWLSANAARFGFFNLPSEPWHWSINGH